MLKKIAYLGTIGAFVFGATQISHADARSDYNSANNQLSADYWRIVNSTNGTPKQAIHNKTVADEEAWVALKIAACGGDITAVSPDSQVQCHTNFTWEQDGILQEVITQQDL